MAVVRTFKFLSLVVSCSNLMPEGFINLKPDASSVFVPKKVVMFWWSYQTKNRFPVQHPQFSLYIIGSLFVSTIFLLHTMKVSMNFPNLYSSVARSTEITTSCVEACVPVTTVLFDLITKIL